MVKLYKGLFLLFSILLVTIAIYPLSFFTSDLMPVQALRTSTLGLKGLEIEIDLPGTTKLYEDASVERDVIYSTYFQDNQHNLIGFVQFWEVKDLDSFLTEAKATSRFDFISFNKKEASMNNLYGFMLDWTALSHDKKSIAGKEFFLKKEKNNILLRISFFTNTGPFTQDQETLIADIISSINWSKTADS